MEPLIDEIRAWFDACGYESQEQVGAVEGTVDRFAVQRRALMPPRTWWTTTARFPADLGDALTRLEGERVARGADRALVIVTDEATPPGYDADLDVRAVNYVSLRYLALHLSGAIEEIRRLASAERDDAYVRRGGTIDLRECPDLCAEIDDWIDQGEEEMLGFDAARAAEVFGLLGEVARVRARRTVERGPDRTCALVRIPGGLRDLAPVQDALRSGMARAPRSAAGTALSLHS